MTEYEHTPGPWERFGYIGSGKGLNLVRTKSGVDGPLVECKEPIKKLIATCERHGDAELIARAPELLSEVQQLRGVIADIRNKLESIVETKGCDRGVVYLSNDGPTHIEMVDGKPCQVYDHENFSPLGDALIEIYDLTLETLERLEAELRWTALDVSEMPSAPQSPATLASESSTQ